MKSISQGPAERCLLKSTTLFGRGCIKKSYNIGNRCTTADTRFYCFDWLNTV